MLFSHNLYILTAPTTTYQLSKLDTVDMQDMSTVCVSGKGV